MSEKLSIFYDGACHLCYREVMGYKKKDSDKLLNLIDISRADFHASDYGLDEGDVNLHMHAMDSSGKVFRGVDTFIEIWKRLPAFHFLIPIFTNQTLRPTINKGYDLFARYIRPNLPKRKCDESCSIETS